VSDDDEQVMVFVFKTCIVCGGDVLCKPDNEQPMCSTHERED
jgi:hypothetical protein